MSNISTAVGSDRISRVIGYKLKKGFFNPSTPNLPQRLAILGEANLANQVALDTSPKEVTSAQEAGELYGYGSPIHQMMRILRPVNSDGVGGIPTIVYPQASDGGATQTVLNINITVSTAAKANETHYAVINGRDNIDGTFYAVSIAKDDTMLQILNKYAAAINNVLGSPVIASVDTSTPGSEFLVLTSKWAGITSKETNVSFDSGNNKAEITYTQSSKTDGAGIVSISTALASFGTEWNTIVVNQYSDQLDTLEAFNGIPDPENPTGRYAAIIFKPFISIWGSVDPDKDNLAAITDPRKAEVTNALAPAPNSKGYTWEAAANMGYLFALTEQNSPHLDVATNAYPDMPVPADGDIGDMADYNNRDFLVKKGASTVDISAGSYVVQDFVTTYHPDGEIPPQYRYCRNLMLDFNVRYGYYLLEQINVVNKALAPNSQAVNVSNVIKPKDWKQILFSYADDLASRALIADPDFMKSNTDVDISSVNPDRFETFFRYKRTGTVRIASTDAEAGFNFGSV